MSTTNILDLNNRIDKIEKTGIGTAAETSYSNTTSGLTATNVQAAIDEIDGATDNLSSAITDIEGDILAIEGDVEDLEKEKVDWTSEGILGAKNMLPYPYFHKTRTSAGVTFTPQTDGTILATGTATGDAWFGVRSRNEYGTGTALMAIKGASYTLSGCPSGGSLDTYFMEISRGTGASSEGTWGDDIGEGYSFTNTDSTEYAINITITIKSGVVIPEGGIVFKPMLRLTADNDNNYKPYAMTNKEITDRLQCPNTVAGTYNLTATVDSNGGVTYAWVLDT